MDTHQAPGHQAGQPAPGQQVSAHAPALIDEALANDTFSPQVGVATYAEKIAPADRELDWSRPARELHDRIRALSPHIGARGEVEGRSVIVWRSRLDGDRLELLEVQPEGGTRMAYEAWLRGLTLLTMSWAEWVRGVEVEPSIYAADFSRLGEQIETVMGAGARILQFDVGDGQFVEPITIGPIVLKSISPVVHELGERPRLPPDDRLTGEALPGDRRGRRDDSVPCTTRCATTCLA